MVPEEPWDGPEDGLDEHPAVTVPESLAGERLDRAVALLTGWTRSEVQALVDAGAVLVDGAAVAKSRRLGVGETVELRDRPRAVAPPGPDPAVPVVVRHEDADVLVVAKPAGLVVHPGPGHVGGTLVNGLLARYPELAGVGEADRPGIVHRLDRDTSGLLAVARSPRAYEVLVAALADHDVERRYLALAWGHFEARRGTVDAPIGRSMRQPTKMAVRDGGRPARTHYEVLSEWDDPRVSLVELRLETGRTHQIRVHLSAVGHAVVGDPIYRGRRPVLEPGRPFLHAFALGFVHPVTGDPVRVEEPLPPELQAVLSGLGAPREG
jgi:23S rRNA pseudouridine1911/1915/1917 synthase